MIEVDFIGVLDCTVHTDDHDERISVYSCRHSRMVKQRMSGRVIFKILSKSDKELVEFLGRGGLAEELYRELHIEADDL